MSLTNRVFLNMEVFMNDREFSYNEIFQHSLFMTDHKNFLQADYNNGGVSSVLRTDRNNVCVANVGNLSARKYKEKIFTEIEDQGSLYPVLKSSSTASRFFASSHCSL